MASLEDLPAPLPLYIARHLADLKSLDSLRRASPLFNIIFHQHAAELVEDLMCKTLIDEVIIEFRAYTLLSLHKSHGYVTESDFNMLYEQAKKPFDATTSVMAISHPLRKFSFLASICNIILRTKLDDLHALPHEHLKDKKPHGQQVLDKLAASPYSIPEAAPPDWVEQQRFLRALWRMRVSSKLCGVANDFATRKLPLMPRAALPQQQRPNWLADEIEEAASSFGDLQAAGSVPNDYSVPPSWDALADVPLPTSKSSSIAIVWGQTLELSTGSAQSQSYGFHYYHLTSHRDPRSPLASTDWNTLRRLGFGLWSNRRLAEELDMKNYPKDLNPPSQGFIYRHGIDSYMSRRELEFTWARLYLAALASRQACTAQ
ncbi:hypothetical protein BDV97DRAFT_399232 [Delphinella strobiligena]|nr:hypothetical protein BDV97DRAFT_399232 [Delphinella strobiligena]